MRETSRVRLVAYGVAVLAAGITLLLRWFLEPWLGHERPLITFFPAVILILMSFSRFAPGIWHPLLNL